MRLGLLAGLQLLQSGRFASPLHASLALLTARHTSGLVHPETLYRLAVLHRMPVELEDWRWS